MELMPNGSLNRHTFISKDNTHRYMSRPLVASHMVYRDLSSNNIRLTKVYVTKITDLEVAEVSFHSQGKPLVPRYSSVHAPIRFD